MYRWTQVLRIGYRTEQYWCQANQAIDPLAVETQKYEKQLGSKGYVFL